MKPVSQVKEQGSKIPFTSIEAIEFTNEPSLFEGSWYVQPADANVAFTKMYMDAYNENYNVGAPNTYDCINLIVTAYENAAKYSAGKPSQADVATEFAKIKGFQGALGELNVDADHIVQSNAAIHMIKDGKFVTISQ